MNSRSEKLVPSLEYSLKQVDEQVADDLSTPLDGIEEEYILFNQMRFNWLTFRVAAQTNIQLLRKEFDSSKPGKSLLKSWREHAMMKG